MGFDFFIKLRLHLCEKTGKPFFYGTKDGDFTQNFDISSITVPEEHREFLYQRGRHMILYTEDVDNIVDYSSADISELLDVFPSWDEIEETLIVNHYEWKKQDHDAFYKALEWFNKQDYPFYATWSY